MDYPCTGRSSIQSQTALIDTFASVTSRAILTVTMLVVD